MHNSRNRMGLLATIVALAASGNPMQEQIGSSMRMQLANRYRGINASRRTGGAAARRAKHKRMNISARKSRRKR